MDQSSDLRAHIMSMGGHSLHQKDWLTLAALGALGGTGLGIAGVGPLAGMMGGEAAGAGAGLLGSDAAAGLGGMGEMAGTVAAPEGALPFSTRVAAGAQGILGDSPFKTLGKAAANYQKFSALGNMGGGSAPIQASTQSMGRGQQGPIPSNMQILNPQAPPMPPPGVSPTDPRWLDYLRRQQQGSFNG